jgi:carbon storage regulator CsrA
MLISCRKEGECLKVGEEIEIRIISVRKNKVTLGVVAPRQVKIATRKLSEMEMANTIAAAQATHVGHLLRTPRSEGENIVFVLEGGDFFGKSPEQADMGNGRPHE